MADWQFLAHSTDGRGKEELIYNEIPFNEVDIHLTMEGTGSLTATLEPEMQYLQDSDGRFVLDPWGTIITAVKDNRVYFCGILSMVSEDGPKISVTAIPFNQYLKSIPYLDKMRVYNKAIHHIIAECWRHVQDQPNGRLRLSVKVDTVKETVGVKTYKRVQKERTVTYKEWAERKLKSGKIKRYQRNAKRKEKYCVNEVETDEPYEMYPWNTSDLDQVVTQLCDTANLKPVESHSIKDGVLTHRLEYKRDSSIGKQRKDLRFIVGENIFSILPVDYNGDTWVSEVWVQGAGDGAKQIREHSFRLGARKLRRVATVSDTSINSRTVAKALAEKHKKARQLDADFSAEIVVHNTPSAELGTYGLGDEIYIQQFEGGWNDQLGMWVYIKEMKIDPFTEIATLTVERVEKRGLDSDG
ncbi:hypothetical protein ACP6NG_17960 [Brevibacterium casei]|uniref:hypothetical protein n=1 Tax=Brevibacterium casei TaxID=33889 RepID=UPI003F7E79DA